MKKASLILLLSTLSFLGNSQEMGPGTPTEKIAFPYKFSASIEAELDSSDKEWRFQLAGTDYSYIGKEKEVFENFYRNNPVREAMTDSAFDSFMSDYKVKAAVPYILKRSKQEQVVIVNEAHHKPKHRIFTSSLLKGLYEQGFRYLGLETLTNRGGIDSTLNTVNYPYYKMGSYTVEPQFGNLVREALQMGYTLFPYEGEGNGKPREINQAKNIAAFMEKHPGEKILIHCGYQHAQEGEIKGWEKAMAGRLLEYTGVNPLTVNQTIYDNRYKVEYMSPMHQRLEIKKPSVLLDSNLMSYLGAESDSGFDIIVLHEKNHYEHGRPIWLVHGKKKWVRIDLSKMKLELPCLLVAIPKEEDYHEAVPTDLIDLNEGEIEVFMALKPGAYVLIAQNKEQAIKYELVVD